MRRTSVAFVALALALPADASCQTMRRLQASDIVNALGYTPVNPSVAAITGGTISGVTLPPADLTQSAATSGQVLEWSGSAWAPAASANSVAGRTGAITLTHSDLTDWTGATSGFLTSAVTSLGGQTGPVACGANVTCNAGTISAAGYALPAATSSVWVA